MFSRRVQRMFKWLLLAIFHLPRFWSCGCLKQFSDSGNFRVRILLATLYSQVFESIHGLALRCGFLSCSFFLRDGFNSKPTDVLEELALLRKTMQEELKDAPLHDEAHGPFYGSDCGSSLPHAIKSHLTKIAASLHDSNSLLLWSYHNLHLAGVQKIHIVSNFALMDDGFPFLDDLFVKQLSQLVQKPWISVRKKRILVLALLSIKHDRHCWETDFWHIVYISHGPRRH
mmetsp:Transcript_92843/g.165080  ORF Transcript_92843/g.165080 Transcript_92843/m.165080 type:complete len:229 (+) Transcript_92843:310-996(+)